MKKYYTRACNFYYGKSSKLQIKKKNSLPLNGNVLISFDHIEILSRNSYKKINIKEIKKLSIHLKKKVKKDLKNITRRKKNFSNLKFTKVPNLMGILNLTPDSFSDGGKFNKNKEGIVHAKKLIKFGADIVDVGGESTRPGAKEIQESKEWKRINFVLKKICKNRAISLDTRKSKIMEKGIKLGVKLINDVSGLDFDTNSINILKKYSTPFVIHHSLGNPEIMQKNPKYKNVLFDIYDFFESKIKFIRMNGIRHNNIILDPGIGFGKNLKHNLTLINNISIFHSLGFPIMMGISRKRFLKDLSGNNDSKQRLGGTISSTLYLMLQGVQVIRVHDVNEIVQSLKVFKELQKN